MNEILHSGIRLFGRYFGVIFGLVLTIALPCQLLLSWLRYFKIGKENVIMLMQSGMILEMLFGVVITGGILHALFVDRMQRRAGFLECFSSGVTQWLRLAWTNFLVMACIMLGTLFLIFPGIYFAIRLSLSLTVTMTEEAWGFAALRRSMALTAGHGWQVASLGIFLYVLILTGQLAVGMLLAIPALDHWWILACLGATVHLLTCLIPVCFFLLYEKLVAEDSREIQEL